MRLLAGLRGAKGETDENKRGEGVEPGRPYSGGKSTALAGSSWSSSDKPSRTGVGCANRFRAAIRRGRSKATISKLRSFSLRRPGESLECCCDRVA